MRNAFHFPWKRHDQSLKEDCESIRLEYCVSKRVVRFKDSTNDIASIIYRVIFYKATIISRKLTKYCSKYKILNLTEKAKTSFDAWSDLELIAAARKFQ